MSRTSRLAAGILAGSSLMLLMAGCSDPGTVGIAGCPDALVAPNTATLTTDYRGDQRLDDARWAWSSGNGGKAILINNLTGEQGDHLVVSGATSRNGGVRLKALGAGTVDVELRQFVRDQGEMHLLKASCSIEVTGTAPTGPTTPSTTFPTTGPTTAPTTEPASPPPSPLPTDLDACSLLTAAEVEDVMGAPVTPAPGRSGPGLAECRYEGSAGSIDLTERFFRSATQAATSFGDVRAHQQNAVPIQGIGDEAFRGDAGYAARAGNVTLVMDVSSSAVPGGPPPPTDDQLQGLLATAVSNLSA